MKQAELHHTRLPRAVCGAAQLVRCSSGLYAGAGIPRFGSSQNPAGLARAVHARYDPPQHLFNSSSPDVPAGPLCASPLPLAPPSSTTWHALAAGTCHVARTERVGCPGCRVRAQVLGAGRPDWRLCADVRGAARGTPPRAAWLVPPPRAVPFVVLFKGPVLRVFGDAYAKQCLIMRYLAMPMGRVL